MIPKIRKKKKRKSAAIEADWVCVCKTGAIGGGEVTLFKELVLEHYTPETQS